MVSHDDVKPVWEVLGRSRGLCERPWAALTASVGGPGLLLRPQRAVLGCSWGLSGRSWAALGASVGGPGLLSRPLWAVLARLRSLLDPGLAVQVGKVALSRAGAGPKGSGRAGKPMAGW